MFNLPLNFEQIRILFFSKILILVFKTLVDLEKE